MSPEKRENTELIIYNRLTELDCCDVCIIRFLGIGVSESENHYQSPREYLDKTFSLTTNDSEEIPSKKIKKNICRLCLYSYNYKTIEKLLENEDFTIFNDYQYDDFQFSISFPKCLAIRSHSMYVYLTKNFPGVIKETLYHIGEEITCIELPHRIFRKIFTDLLVKKIGKKYNPSSALKVHLTLTYEKDNEETENIKQLLPRNHSNKKHQPLEASRSNITEILKNIDDGTFIKHFPIPPELPDNSVIMDKLQITTDPLYLGGRYIKFKRNVGQTPWIIDGVSITENNVQTTIFNAIYNVLNIDQSLLTFTASGREDVDVRMLGNGRPFYIKIQNPKFTNIPSEKLFEIEQQVIKTELVAVTNLKIVDAQSIDKIKLGEEQKMKTYKALCKTSAPNIKEAIELINKQPENLMITQLTAIRVLHRRTLLPRERIIYKMSATEIPEYPDMFELVVATQAGTYVKEFVHSDFDRTQPSITSVIGYSTDIIALDCTDIDLEWP